MANVTAPQKTVELAVTGTARAQGNWKSRSKPPKAMTNQIYALSSVVE